MPPVKSLGPIKGTNAESRKWPKPMQSSWGLHNSSFLAIALRPETQRQWKQVKLKHGLNPTFNKESTSSGLVSSA
jgi:hypothetical protein